MTIEYESLLEPDSAPARHHSPVDLLNLRPEPQQAIPAVISGEELAILMGISGRAVRDMALSGKIPKLGKDRYPTRTVLGAYLTTLREVAAGRAGSTGNLTEERTRLAKEQADKIELANAATRGEMIPASAVEHAWATTLRDVRAAMLAIPGRLPMLDRATIERLDREIRDALTEAAK